MTTPITPLQPAPVAPITPVSINDSLPTSSPSTRSTLIGLGCVLGIIALLVLYTKVIGF